MSHRYNEQKRRLRALDAFLYEPRCSKAISFKGVAGIDQYALERREPLASVRRTYANLEVQALGIRDSANWADTERLFRLGKCLSLGDSMVKSSSHSRSAADRFPLLLQELPGSVIPGRSPTAPMRARTLRP